MNDKISSIEISGVKPCRKCGGLDRYKSGKCKNCTQASNNKWKNDNLERAKQMSEDWRKANMERVRNNSRKNYKLNQKRELERARKYREANPEKVLERNRNWREANPEKQKEASRNWQKANPEKVAERNRNWIEANPEKAKKIRKKAQSKWNKANPDKIRAAYHTRRAKIKGNGGKLSSEIVQTLMDRQKGKCACCGASLKNGYHLDHIMPIALGGSNSDDNIQLLTPLCNRRKSAKHPVDYMREKGLLL